jgi:hypothetical protein
MGLFVKNIFAFGKKVFLVLFVYALVLSLFSFFSNAKQDTKSKGPNPIVESRKKIYTRLFSEETNKTFVGRSTAKVLRVFTCAFSGEACTKNPTDGDKNFNASIFGMLSKGIAFPYQQPPASGVYWVTATLENAGFIPKSYAAEGVGFAAIKPLMGLWKSFRDVSYLLAVIFLIAVGFMIMFRMKINPQTVISVENTLPKIITVLLLVTFSFPIAGFMVDLMYVLTAVGVSLIAKGGSGTVLYDVAEFQKTFLNAGPSVIFNSILGHPFGFNNNLFVNMIPGVGPIASIVNSPIGVLYFFGWQFRAMLGWFIGLILDIVFGVVFAFFIFPQVKNAVGIQDLAQSLDGIILAAEGAGKIPSAFMQPIYNTVLTVAGLILGVFLVPAILGLLFFFTVLYLWARIFVMLLTAYIQTMLLIIFSPVYISMELLPGSKMTFTQWLKNLAGELIAFPLVAILFSVAYVIGQQSVIANGLNGNFFSPPFIIGLDANAIATLVSFGLTILIPDLVKSIKEGIGAKGVGMGAGIGMFFGGAGAAVGGTMSMVGQYGSISMAFPQLREKVNPFINSIFGFNSKEAPPNVGQQPDTKKH